MRQRAVLGAEPGAEERKTGCLNSTRNAIVLPTASTPSNVPAEKGARGLCAS